MVSCTEKTVDTQGLVQKPTVVKVTVRHLKIDLRVPYKLSYRTFTAFEPYLVEITGSNGVRGWGDGHISPGSSEETREGGWDFLKEAIPKVLGLSVEEALELISPDIRKSKVAGSALCLALEMLQEPSLLEIDVASSLPLLAPVNSNDRYAIEREIEDKLAQGFRTFKIKVGKDVRADLKRVSLIQNVVENRATLRVDANRGYSQEDGRRFASSIAPDSLELFEQPCAAEDWVANAAVAAVSNVPLMLDEPICSKEDIFKAAEIKGVGFCKLKLKRFGTLQELYAGLNYVRECGMEPVLGDGLGSESTSWMEACIARKTIRNAGEFNGFLKAREGILTAPLAFEKGNVILPKGYYPQLDDAKIEMFTQAMMSFE